MSEDRWEQEFAAERAARLKKFARYDITKLSALPTSERRTKEYLVSRRERPDRVTDTILVVTYDRKEEWDRHLRQETRQLFLCVNGPMVGKRIKDDERTDYVVYNRSGHNWGRGDVPTAVLIWEPTLTGKITRETIKNVKRSK